MVDLYELATFGRYRTS